MDISKEFEYILLKSILEKSEYFSRSKTFKLELSI